VFSLKRVSWWVGIVGMYFSSCTVQARTTIELWHAMAGPLGTEVERLAQQFNQSQSSYELKPVYKGSYLETLTAYAAAYRAHQAPALVQVFDVGTPTMLHPEGVIEPVETLMKKFGQDKLLSALWPALKQNYSYHHLLQALPWNVSLPVMYYNADALTPYGIHSSKDFPKTWQALDALFQRIHAHKQGCIYTSAYPSWIHQEAFQALNQVPSALTSMSLMQQSHLERLLRWNQADWFQYAGRYDESTVLMTSARCWMFSQSSGAYASLQAISRFHLGMAMLPVDERAERGNNLVGGAALWVTRGLSSKVQEGIVQWFTQLLKPKTQRQWFEATGYLPLQPLPLREVHSRELKKMLRLITFEWGKQDHTLPKHQALTRIRSMNDELIEAMLAQLISPQDAWIQMQENARRADERFYNNHGDSPKGS
jgi:sn-glycerol 3-phosphate transport system substrate-binding protein